MSDEVMPAEPAATEQAQAGDETRLPKAELDKFLRLDQVVKREAKNWGSKAATRVLKRLLQFVTCPLRSVDVSTWPKNTARTGYYQNAVANAQAGGVYVRMGFDVDKDGPSLRVWLEARMDPADRETGWIRSNSKIVKEVVERYTDVPGRSHSRNERKGDFVPVPSARFLTFRRYLSDYSADGSELIITDKVLLEFAGDFDDIMDAVMRETLTIRQHRYRYLRSIVPPEVANTGVEEADQPILERAAVVRALLAALETRPLVLLAGVSGTGKTQLAQRIGLARALGILEDTEGKEGSVVDRQYAALIPEVVQPIGDGEWVWVRMPSVELADESPEEDESAELADDAVLDDAPDDEANLDEEGEEYGEPGEEDGAGPPVGIGAGPPVGIDRRFALVPVQSDWKEASSLWGWYHPVGEAAFHGSPALRVFLDAWQKTSKGLRATHTVVLDEMNLSRLEHYGSDLLSAMENPGLPMISLHRLGADAPLAGSDSVVPSQIGWRDGVRVIGTVNVDETTFSFAPKVLDRAAVLEFVDVDLERFFLRSGKELEWKVLGPWFDAVQAATRPHNLHLGYRAAREIVATLKADLGDDVAAWQPERLAPLLDNQLRNKVLPRVRGPRGTAEPVLIALLALATTWPEAPTKKQRELNDLARAGWPPEEAEVLRAALVCGSAGEKAWQMLLRLRDVGFTGFF